MKHNIYKMDCEFCEKPRQYNARVKCTFCGEYAWCGRGYIRQFIKEKGILTCRFCNVSFGTKKTRKEIRAGVSEIKKKLQGEDTLKETIKMMLLNALLD